MDPVSQHSHLYRRSGLSLDSVFLHCNPRPTHRFHCALLCGNPYIALEPSFLANWGDRALFWYVNS